MIGNNCFYPKEKKPHADIPPSLQHGTWCLHVTPDFVTTWNLIFFPLTFSPSFLWFELASSSLEPLNHLTPPLARALPGSLSPQDHQWPASDNLRNKAWGQWPQRQITSRLGLCLSSGPRKVNWSHQPNWCDTRQNDSLADMGTRCNDHHPPP